MKRMAYIEMNGQMRILVVDPEIENAQAMKQYLRRVGYTNGLNVSSGYDAMHLIRGAKVDFVLCRMSLPVMSGTDLFEEMKQDFSVSRIPFAIFEERMPSEDVALLKEYGVDGTLSLPFAQKDLAELLAKTWARYIDKSNPEYLFEQARRLFASGHDAEAQKIFQALLEKGHHTERALVGLARIAKRANDFDLGISLATQVTKEKPECVHGHQLLGEILAAKGNRVDAIASLTKAIEISPKNPYRYEVVGDLLNSVGMWEDAEKLYRRALELDLTFPRLLAGLASSLAGQGKRGEAIKIYEDLVRKNPKEASFFNNLAACYKNDGNHLEATLNYRKALEILPKDTRIMFNLALLLNTQGNRDGAIGYLRKAVQIDPHYEKARIKLDEWEGRPPSVSVAKSGEVKNTEAKAAAVKVDEGENSVTQELSAEDQARLTKLVGKVHGADLAVQGTAVEISEAERQVIVSVKPDVMRQAFHGMCLRTRKIFAGIFSGYSQQIALISGEVVQILLEVTQYAEKEGKGESLAEGVNIVMTTLQFQDELTQLLNAYQKSYGAIAEKGHTAVIADLQEAIKSFPVVGFRQKLTKIANQMLKQKRGQFRANGLAYIEVLEFFGLELLAELAAGLDNGGKSLGRVAELFRDAGSSDEVAGSLEGSASHLGILGLRLKNLRQMLELGMGTLLHAENDQTARQVLLIFGKDVRGLWPRLILFCETPEEREIVQASEKKVGAAATAKTPAAQQKT
jgi:tetratricopeptide (TPR) repeat protein